MIEPYKARPFQSFARPEGGSEARMPKIKVNVNRLKRKLCVSHYSHKSILDGKFKADSCSSFGDMTAQNFPWKKGSHQIRLFTPGKRV